MADYSCTKDAVRPPARFLPSYHYLCYPSLFLLTPHITYALAAVGRTDLFSFASYQQDNSKWGGGGGRLQGAFRCEIK